MTTVTGELGLRSPSKTKGDTNDDSHRGARAQEPIHKETEVILHENNHFYRNGNPKPPRLSNS